MVHLDGNDEVDSSTRAERPGSQEGTGLGRREEISGEKGGEVKEGFEMRVGTREVLNLLRRRSQAEILA